MAQHIARPVDPSRGCLPSLTPLSSLLASLVDSSPLPDWSAAQWVAILHAPQASQRVSRFAAQRVIAGAAVIERPEVVRLVLWVHSIWPGSLRAVAGALAAARQVQKAHPADLGAAAIDVVDEIRRSLARPNHRSTRTRVVPVDPAQLRVIEPAPPPPGAPSRIADAVSWMVRFTDLDDQLPLPVRLELEAGISLFLDWYVDHLATPHGVSPIVSIPPSRALSPNKRLSTRLGDRELVLLLAGPPGSRRCPAELASQRGMGYWTIVALVCWARGTEPSEPPPEARQWWSHHLRVLGARFELPCPPAAVAVRPSPAEAVSQAM